MMFRQFVRTSLLRCWLGFSALTVLGWAAFLVIDGDNPLRSDDPYLVGLICGVFAAVMGLLYSLLEKACTSRTLSTTCYLAILCLWAFLFITLSAQAPEGADIARFIAIAQLLSGVISWPLFAFKIPHGVIALLSGTGLAVLVMYGVVVVRMASMHSAG